MHAYDFDETIFQPDSSFHFVRYCLRHYPRAVLRALPGTVVTGVQRLAGKADTRALKEKAFAFLPYLEDVDRIVLEFWEENKDGIQDWYLRQKREDDVIVSASPEFLLRPIADWLGVRLIATPMDRHTGRIIGKNCHDYEKVFRFRAAFPGERIEVFYSDSLSDTPMARLADKAFLVKKDRVLPWPGL